VNLSKEVRCRSKELPGLLLDGLLGDPGESSCPLATTASIGRRGRLYRIVRLRVGCPESESDSFLRPPDLVGDSSALCFTLFAVEGDGDLDEDPNGLRARLTIRPDIERLFDGRAAGSGALCSGNLAPAFWSKSSDDDSVKWVTAAEVLFLDRRDVRRKISFPAATLSLVGFVGDSACVGTA
jgi:hypothetical protein